MTPWRPSQDLQFGAVRLDARGDGWDNKGGECKGMGECGGRVDEWLWTGGRQEMTDRVWSEEDSHPEGSSNIDNSHNIRNTVHSGYKGHVYKGQSVIMDRWLGQNLFPLFQFK